MLDNYQELSDQQLAELVYQWQGDPKKYTNLLTQQIFPTLKKLCQKELVNNPQDYSLPISASSLVNEIYFDLAQGPGQSQIDSLRTFYTHLRHIIRAILIDKHRKLAAKKRALEDPDNYKQRQDYAAFINMNQEKIDPNDIEVFEYGVNKLKQLEPEAAEALAIKYYTAKNVEQIAYIMNKSKSTINRYLTSGKDIINALVLGAEINV